MILRTVGRFIRIEYFIIEIDTFFPSFRMNDTFPLHTLLLTIGIYICPYIMATRIAHDSSTTFTFFVPRTRLVRMY